MPPDSIPNGNQCIEGGGRFGNTHIVLCADFLSPSWRIVFIPFSLSHAGGPYQPVVSGFGGGGELVRDWQQ
jgi:hypothetical protein